MAAPKAHLFKTGALSRVLSKNNEYFQQNVEIGNIIAIYENTLFSWNPDTQCLLSKSYIEDLPENDYVKKLLLTKPPLFEVSSIAINSVGSLMAVWGQRGAAVMEFPRHFWQSGYLKDQEVLCRSWNIDERLFMCNSHIAINHGAWHPCSPNHLVILTNDNILRIYDISQPVYPIQNIPLGEANTSLGPSTFANYQEKTAVCFDFGQPLSALCCPIFILKGNGDVLMLYSDLDRKHARGEAVPTVMGPLIMHPAADDNYGVDSCSLVCLAVEPPLLAISTSEGLLHHALALVVPSPAGQQSEEERPQLALYVYETIELSLTLAPEEEEKKSSPSYPIQLFKDPSTNCRYHCSHEAGIHTIMLPLVRRIELLQELGEEKGESLMSVLHHQPSIVEHVLCTRPTLESPRCHVRGGAVWAGHRGAWLMALLANWEIVALPLVMAFPTEDSVVVEEEEVQQESMQPPKEMSLSFEQHIRHQLRHTTGGTPLLKSTGDISPHRALEVLLTATEKLRRDYIDNLTTAQAGLIRRTKILDEQMRCQQKDLQHLLRAKEELCQKAEQLAEKYESVSIVHLEFTLHMEKVLQDLQRRLPQLSSAELSMQKELTEMETKLERYQALVRDARTKWEFQRRTAARVRQASYSGTCSLTTPQMTSLKAMLQKEGQTLADLVKRVTSLKKEVGL